MKSYLKRGAISGAAGGLVLAVVLRVLGEPAIGRAVSIESARHPHAGPDMFNRGTQQVGGMVAAAIYGVALGTVFAIVFVAVRHRLTARDDWRRAVALAAVAFTTITLVPFLKYPANPPGVGDPDTIGRRTALYLVVLAWSIVSTWGAWRALRWLRARGVASEWRGPLTVALHVLLVGLGFLALPPIRDAVTVPATLLWRFRVASLAGTASYWVVSGVVFGWLCLRAAARSEARQVAAAGLAPAAPE